MNKKKRLFIICGIAVLVISIITTSILFIVRNKDDKNKEYFVIKENVQTITSETPLEYLPVAVTDNTLVFNKDPQYKQGDIIVSGVIDEAPDGFIRKVISKRYENNNYIYETEYAVLTDVFESAHIERTFTIEKPTSSTTSEINVQPTALETLNIQNPSIIQLSSDDRDLLFKGKFEHKIDDAISVKGDVGFDVWFELIIDIEDGNIVISIVNHTKTEGNIHLGTKGAFFDKDKDEGSYKHELFSYDLPNIQFSIGYVPVVITNDFEATFEADMQIEGSIGTTLNIGSERISGFKYDSKTGEITEINERKYLGEGLNWDTSAKATGKAKAGVYGHFITKLYGSTGADLSIGIMGSVEGKLFAGMSSDKDFGCYGSLAVKVGPEAKGSIVVSVPVIDKKLAESPLFEVTFPLFIDKKWEAESPILSKLQNGDFSMFAGTYKAQKGSADTYGSGEPLSDLVLNSDGTISGGEAYYDVNECIVDYGKPISVTQNDDGSYFCFCETVTKNGKEFKNGFTIYPSGIMDEWAEEYGQEYLKDPVYIYIFRAGAGVLDIRYYME